MDRQPKKSIKLALQGGGSHGAFTWGVLDQLLEDERLHIAAVSGTSAGAMNAVALADGMARGGPAEARKCLEKFWSATSAAAQYSPIRRSIFDIFMGNWSLDTSPTYIFMDHLSRILSPYDLNPMNLNPLRDVLAGCVDFDSVNDPRRSAVIFGRNQCSHWQAQDFPATRDPARQRHGVRVPAVCLQSRGNRRRGLLGRGLHGQSSPLSARRRMRCR